MIFLVKHPVVDMLTKYLGYKNNEFTQLYLRYSRMYMIRRPDEKNISVLTNFVLAGFLECVPKRI